MSSAAALERSDRTRGASDHDLVRAVRHGDDRAFEVLYSRYQRRIAAYVFGMVKDYGRAEDVTQEVFVAALRRMRQTERPIAFKPWIYEIAKNACIDAYRRGRRAEEVSFDADDRLSPADHGRLVATGPEPDAAVTAKQDIDHLRGAFGGLSDSHHQILVMREFEGRSYKDIGGRLGMSRPAVESTLFRARKRLGEEYDELASGARCLRIQAIIDGAQDARLGARETRKLARHVSHCQPCRRLAAHAGLDIPVPARRRVAGRIAAWLPLPGFLRLRRGGDDAVSAGGHANWLAQVPTLAEPLSSGWGKAAAGLAALALAGGGVGVTTSVGGDERGASDKPAAANTVNGAEPAAGSRLGSSAMRATGTAQNAARTGAGARPASGDGAGGGGGDGARTGAGASARAGSGDGAGGSGATDRGGSGGATGGGGTGTRPGGVAPALEVPRAEVPATGTRPVHEAVDKVEEAARNTGENVQKTVEKAVEKVGPAVPNPGSTVPDVPKAAGDAVPAVPDVPAAAGDAVRGAGAAVPGVPPAAGNAVQGAGAAASGAAGNAVGGAGAAAAGASSAAGNAAQGAGAAAAGALGGATSAAGSLPKP